MAGVMDDLMLQIIRHKTWPANPSFYSKLFHVIIALKGLIWEGVNNERIIALLGNKKEVESIHWGKSGNECFYLYSFRNLRFNMQDVSLYGIITV